MVFDPLEFNKKLYQEWEKRLGEFLDKRIRDPEFMALVGKGMGWTMDAKANLDARLSEWLQGLSLPTKEDMEKVWATLNGLETRLIDLEDKLEAISRLREVRTFAGEPAPEQPAKNMKNKTDRTKKKNVSKKATRAPAARRKRA